MSSSKQLLGNRSAALTDIGMQVQVENDSMVSKKTAISGKYRRKRRKGKRKQIIPANSKESHFPSLTSGDCKEGSKIDAEKVASPTTIKNIMVAAREIAPERPETDLRDIMDSNEPSRAANRKLEQPQSKNTENKPITGNSLKKIVRGKRSRPEFETPTLWLMENTARLFFGDIVVNCAQQFYSRFSYYNEILKADGRKTEKYRARFIFAP